jgi:hypothetical protein
MGAPVIYPQQPGMPVYHNRALWPFVTAYGLRAAAMTGNASVADAAYRSLMRGAALNLSNMENLEWLSGQPLLLDEKNPSLIGPVINSRRQLWSVGAYLGMVIGNVFGISTGSTGIGVNPFITGQLRRETFGQSDSIMLHRLRLRGKNITVTIHLPPAGPGDGYYPVDSVTLNGARKAGTIAWDDLPADSNIDIRLGVLLPGQQEIHRVSADPYSESQAVFGPREPAIAKLARGTAGQVRLDIDAGNNAAATVYNVYRDGRLVTAGLPAGAWTDRGAGATGCYSVEAQFASSGNRSHHSAASCIGAGIEIPASDARVKSNVLPDGAAPRLKDWGKPADRFTVDGIRVPAAGLYQVQVRYHNGANQINLGISAGVKWLAVKDASGSVVARGVVQLPHARIEKTSTPPVYSTPLAAHLRAGEYKLELTDFYNMSYLQSNSTFSAAGGADGAFNRFDIHGVRLLRVK